MIPNRVIAYAAALAAFLLLAFAAHHYYAAYKDTAHELGLARDTITDMQKRQQSVAALDTKYTKELADAKRENESLRDDVRNGAKRLRLAATCGKPATAAPGVDDGGAAELTDDARQDYFTLRDQLATSDKMIRGLQAYIREQLIK